MHVVYIPGKKAIMTIYEGDDSTINNVWDDSGSTTMKVKETIVLSDYTTKVRC